jgi:hypothetical protein
MTRRLLPVVLAVCLATSAQTTLTLEQLISFVKSSIQLGHQDKKVARFLSKVTLTQKLDDRTIIELQAMGAGPKTVEAMRKLQEVSKKLPEPPAPPPKPHRPSIPAPSLGEQNNIIKEVREYALSYVQRLPDFICTQVTRRYVDPSGREFWGRRDVITARLTYFEQKENYKLVLVNGRMTDLPYESLGGAISTGEFGSMMREIFEKETEAEFRWERWATLRGKRAHVFFYRVAQPQSKWRIEYERREHVFPGYHGLIYVDRDTLMVMRITLEAEDIPASFPIQQASSMLDYDYTKISGREYMLPLRAVVRIREGKLLAKNEVEFRLYRKFAAEATITFETPEPLPEERITEQPPQP